MDSKSISLKSLKKPLNKFYKPKSKKIAKPFRQAVQKIVNSNLETFCAVRQIWQQQPVPGTGLSSSTGYGLTTTGLSGAPESIVPTVPAGSGDANRKGDVIRPKGMIVKFVLRALDTTGNTAGTNPFRGKPFLVRVIIFNHRYANDDYDTNNIIDKGNTSGNLDSLPDSWLEPYNKKEFRILYSKTFKMCAFSDTATTPPTLENSPNYLHNYIVKKVRLSVPRKLLYSNNANTLPSNYSPKMSIAVCNMDGSGATNIQFRCIVNAEAQLYYTDA